MGPVIFSRLSMFPAVLFLIVMVGCSNAEESAPMETNMVFYLQDWVTGPNVTAVPVAGLKNSTVLGFGTITVIDDAVTEGIERNSTQVGRAQGIYVNSALDGSDLHLAFSIVFTNEKYNGSTLEIQGADRWPLTQREVSVVSGTGMFRFVRGYAVLETAYFSGFNAVIKWNVTLRHY
ncbi:dirigent protein 1-like [Magnolia sinica]|uniref:dirigent protein 1-like n=1 Tax=Magnolia sinica TaxID=86752 RepID=UPI002659FA41|nr:dirigent protein 1-like [Magnolia sinica]